MKFSDITLPSNRKFGLFFTMVFLLFSAYFFQNKMVLLAKCFIGASLIFLLLSSLLPRLLMPLNYLWMYLGFLLGCIISPLVLGFIFFVIFTPISLLMKLGGRDELRVKLYRRTSYWKKRDVDEAGVSHFENQF